MASFRVYGKGHSIRARGLTRVPNYPTYPVYLPYPERVIPPGHETPKISAYFNIRINSGLFSSIREGSFHQGTRENPRSKTFPLIVISGKFQGSFRVYGKGHSIRAREKTETHNFSAYFNIRNIFVLLSSIRKGLFHQGTRHDIRLIPYTLHFRNKMGRPIGDEDFGWSVVFFYHHLNLAQHLIMCLF